MKKYEGYSWIKVKRYKMDETKSWEERYKELEQHHIEETTFLIEEVRKLSEMYEQLLDDVVGPGEDPEINYSAFWNVVVDCLVEFHGRKREDAELEVNDFCNNNLFDDDLLYSMEPFAFACDLAKNTLEIGLFVERYEQILENRGW